MRWMALMISSLKYHQVKRTQQLKEHTASRSRKALNLVSVDNRRITFWGTWHMLKVKSTLCSNDLMPLALNIEIIILSSAFHTERLLCKVSL